NGQMLALNRVACGPVMVTENIRFNSRYDNGRAVSSDLEQQAWYYPDGHIVTYLAGVKGARWFYPFARLDGTVGQEMISSEWGRLDSYFQTINYTSNGSMYMKRERIRDKLVLSGEELLDVPGVLLMLTRLYQADDNARQSIPGDGSLTGAPG